MINSNDLERDFSKKEVTHFFASHFKIIPTVRASTLEMSDKLTGIRRRDPLRANPYADQAGRQPP